MAFSQTKRQPHEFKHKIKKGLVTVAAHKMSDEIAIGTLISIFKQAQIKKTMRKYLVVYEKTKTGYSAYVPDLLGVVATGPSKSLVEKNIFEVIQFHLDGMRVFA